MLLTVHGVYLVYLGLVLVWNVLAVRDAEGRRRWESWAALPLQTALVVVLVRDHMFPWEPAWLANPAVAALFPVAFLVTLMQNTAAIIGRGARLVDIPIVLANVGLGACATIGTLALGGHLLSRAETTLLYDHSVLQVLLGGSRLAYTSTLAWHLPTLAMRADPTSLPRAAARLVVPAVAAFAAVVLVVFHAPARQVVDSFAIEPRLAEEPRLSLRAPLAGGVLTDVTSSSWASGLGGWAPGGTTTPAGSWDAWVVPADVDPASLPTPLRPLVLELRPPDAWTLSLPDPTEAAAVFLDGAERLAQALQPALLLPFPEPDHEALDRAGLRLTPEEWHELYRDARRRIRAVSPSTRVACRLATISTFTRRLYDLLAADRQAVDVLGPRLQPGGAPQGAGWADISLDLWDDWATNIEDPPEFWILAAGASHMAFGRAAQERFVEGCLARAVRRPDVVGILVDGWTDVGDTRGVSRSQVLPRVFTNVPGW